MTGQPTRPDRPDSPFGPSLKILGGKRLEWALTVRIEGATVGPEEAGWAWAARGVSYPYAETPMEWKFGVQLVRAGLASSSSSSSFLRFLVCIVADERELPLRLAVEANRGDRTRRT